MRRLRYNRTLSDVAEAIAAANSSSDVVFASAGTCDIGRCAGRGRPERTVDGVLWVGMGPETTRRGTSAVRRQQGYPPWVLHGLRDSAACSCSLGDFRENAQRLFATLKDFAGVRTDSPTVRGRAATTADGHDSAAPERMPTGHICAGIGCAGTVVWITPSAIHEKKLTALQSACEAKRVLRGARRVLGGAYRTLLRVRCALHAACTRIRAL